MPPIFPFYLGAPSTLLDNEVNIDHIELSLSFIIPCLHKLIYANYEELSSKLLSSANSMVCNLVDSIPLNNTS